MGENVTLYLHVTRRNGNDEFATAGSNAKSRQPSLSSYVCEPILLVGIEEMFNLRELKIAYGEGKLRNQNG
jgi:hypothetical protein